MRLQEKVALVTGGGAGIGRAVVERFVDEGARVAVLERDPERVASLEEGREGSVIAIEGDIADYGSVAAAVERTLGEFSRLDVVCANAGIFDGGLSLREISVERLDDAFDELYGVNVKGQLHTAKATIPALEESGGTLIFTCSFASYAASGGGILYTSSKHAVLGLVRQLAYELGPRVRVNGVAPGAVSTTMTGVAALDQSAIPSLLPGSEEMLPIPFVPNPLDYAECYVFLASDAARVMTGAVLPAYNGLDIRGIAKPAAGFGDAAVGR